MMTEIGQLVFNRDSLEDNTTAVPVLQYNQFGWSRFSNMLYLESPVPTPLRPPSPSSGLMSPLSPSSETRTLLCNCAGRCGVLVL
jgi:hypothetical protein